MHLTRLLAAAALTCALVPVPAAGAPKACSAPEFRQFDFWVGNWKVTDRATGQAAGTNDITREFGGCVVQEHWIDTQGSHGSSFNIYDPKTKAWHQAWVDDNGLYLDLSGHFAHGAMVLSGSRPGKGGRPAIDRITWTKQADGSVRQFWQSSADGGVTWKTSFDGIYRPA